MNQETKQTARQELNSQFWALLNQANASLDNLDHAIKSNTTVMYDRRKEPRIEIKRLDS